MVLPSDLLRGSSFVVTGGAGFIGSHLVSALLANDAKRIVVIDSLRTGKWENLPSDSRIEQVTADLVHLGAGDLQRLLASSDVLFHLSAEKHNQSVDIPERVLQVNVDATFRLFSAAASAKVARAVFTSSLYAAGRMTLPPMMESDLPEPRTIYGISKLTGEHLLRHFASSLRTTALRLFFTYGPRQFVGSGYKSVIVTNFERILRGEAPVIHGDGAQSLDYVHVDDVVRALILSLSDSARDQVINIGSGSAISVSALTELMLEVAGSSLRPVHAPPDWTAGSHRVSDHRKAQTLLGWSPSISMVDGLASVYAWMKSR